jgi:hypothetical protein
MAPNRRERRRNRKAPSSITSSGAPDPLLRLEPLPPGILAAAVAVGVVGYWFLAQGSISAAPVLLVIAYLILLPLALVLPARGGRGKGEDSSSGQS